MVRIQLEEEVRDVVRELLDQEMLVVLSDIDDLEEGRRGFQRLDALERRELLRTLRAKVRTIDGALRALEGGGA